MAEAYEACDCSARTTTAACTTHPLPFSILWHVQLSELNGRVWLRLAVSDLSLALFGGFGPLAPALRAVLQTLQYFCRGGPATCITARGPTINTLSECTEHKETHEFHETIRGPVDGAARDHE